MKINLTLFLACTQVIADTQRGYSVPDVELRESLKRDNKEYILPKYSAFYDKYANIAFTKNPEKYVRYTAAQGGGHRNAAS